MMKLTEELMVTRRLLAMVSSSTTIFMSSKILMMNASTLHTKNTDTTTSNITARPISFLWSRESCWRSWLAARTWRRQHIAIKMVTAS